MVLKNSFPITERLGLTINTSCCCAIGAKAPVWRVPTNPSLKAGVSDGLIVRLSSRRSLNWALALTVPDLRSAGQQTCSDYLLSIPKGGRRGLYLCVLRALCGELLRNFNSQKISRYSRDDSFVSFRSNTN